MIFPGVCRLSVCFLLSLSLSLVPHRAYKRLALQYHPDKNPNDRATAEINFKRLNEAYSTLHDAKRRKTYEQFGKHGLQYGTPTSTDDLFASFFGKTRTSDDIFASFFGSSFRRGGGTVPPTPQTPPKPPYPKGPDVIPYGTDVKVFGLSQAPQHN